MDSDLEMLLRPPRSGGLRISTIRSGALENAGLILDAKHYQAEFTAARNRLTGSGLDLVTVRELAQAFVPKRAKLTTVSHPSAGAPYLKAHEAFDIRPESQRYLVESRTPGYEEYLLEEGMILTPSSGRNLGPIAYVDRHLAQFAMTNIIRIQPHKRADGLYLLAYLLTPTAQALIRRGKTGTTVDHLSAEDVLRLPVAWGEVAYRKGVVARMSRAVRLRANAIEALDDAEQEFHQRAGLTLPFNTGTSKMFNITADRLTGRIDAAYYDPEVNSAMSHVAMLGGVPLVECAELRMLKRYKRYYVDCASGRPILSGTQMLQYRPVNLQCISERSFSRPEEFILHRG